MKDANGNEMNMRGIDWAARKVTIFGQDVSFDYVSNMAQANAGCLLLSERALGRWWSLENLAARLKAADDGAIASMQIDSARSKDRNVSIVLAIPFWIMLCDDQKEVFGKMYDLADHVTISNVGDDNALRVAFVVENLWTDFAE